MTTPREPGSTHGSTPNGVPAWAGGAVMAVVVAAAAFVFLRQPAAGATSPHASTARDSGPRAVGDATKPDPSRALKEFFASPSSADDATENDAARALTLRAPTLSPTGVIPDSLQADEAYRVQQQNLCVERAAGVVSSGGQGIGSAHVDHAGMADDSLVFDGAARSTTGRAMVWRCSIATSGYGVGRVMFASADSVSGLVLEWNPVTMLDDFVLRRCLVRAQKLFSGKTVLPRASGRRRDDNVHLVGVAEGGGVSTNWSCDVTVHGDKVVALSARAGG